MGQEELCPVPLMIKPLGGDLKVWGSTEKVLWPMRCKRSFLVGRTCGVGVACGGGRGLRGGQSQDWTCYREPKKKWLGQRFPDGVRGMRTWKGCWRRHAAHAFPTSCPESSEEPYRKDFLFCFVLSCLILLPKLFLNTKILFFFEY